MCGIVGLLVKRNELECELGRLVTPMLQCMGTRGADSTGLAFFYSPLDSAHRRFGLYAEDPQFDWEAWHDSFRRESGQDSRIRVVGNHAGVISTLPAVQLKSWLRRLPGDVRLLSVGRAIDVYKDVGPPDEIAKRYRFAEFAGTHAIGHTRMATESAVSLSRAHPITAGEDFCLVHNGSLSNPYSSRRKLELKGVRFETDNDTEAGCRFLEWRMREGDTLEAAIEKSFRELDGFFTFLMATAERMVLVRDAFACKPAVVAETDDYVAVGSEFRALAHLPHVQEAQVFEPAPETIYSWTVSRN